MITFLKYTGDHAGVSGLGGGGGGGGAAGEASTVLQALNEEPSWTDNSITIDESIEGNLQIGNGSPLYLKWGSSDLGASIHGLPGSFLAFYVNGYDMLSMNASGSTYFGSTNNVGIGTPGPYCNLHISKETAVTATNIEDYYLLIGGNENVIGMHCRIAFGYVYDNTLKPPAYIGYQEESNASGTHGALVFGTRYGEPSAGTLAPTERMRIAADGNVGIGTTSPLCKLDLGDLGGGSIRLGRDHDGSNTSTNSIGRSGTNGSWTSRICFFDDSTNDDGIYFTTHQSGVGEVERMRILGDGNVGIGTTDPYYKLEVKGGTGLGITYNSDHSYGIIIKMQDTNYGYIQTIKQGTGYNYDLCLQPSGGNVGIGTTTPTALLEVNGSLRIGSGSRLMFGSGSSAAIEGNEQGHVMIVTDGSYRMNIDNDGITCTGDITAYGSVSDITLKRNIVTLNTKDILNKVLKIRPVGFKWVDDLENERRRGKQDEGLIAQEIEKIWPMLVGETISLKKGCKDKYKYIHYNKLSVYMAGAIQEQQKEITELRNENNLLKQQMSTVLERLAALESK